MSFFMQVCQSVYVHTVPSWSPAEVPEHNNLLAWAGSVLFACVFIKLHKTGQPGPETLSFKCYTPYRSILLWEISGYSCNMCIYQNAHDRATRSFILISMLQGRIHLMEDQCLHPRRQHLMRRVKGNTLSVHFSCNYLNIFHLPSRPYIYSHFLTSDVPYSPWSRGSSLLPHTSCLNVLTQSGWSTSETHQR